MKTLLQSEWLGWYCAGVIFVASVLYVLYWRLRLWWALRQNKRLNTQVKVQRAYLSFKLIEELRTGIAESVTIHQPNDDGPPHEMVTLCGEWTKFEEVSFTGATLLEALTAAATAKRLGEARLKADLEKFLQKPLWTDTYREGDQQP